MTLHDIQGLLGASVISHEGGLEMYIDRAYCADLMSDVLAFSLTNSLLITGLTNAQVVRTAEVANITAIVFVQGKRPDMKTVALAGQKKIPLLVTDISMFDACGRLYERGLRSGSDLGF